MQNYDEDRSQMMNYACFLACALVCVGCKPKPSLPDPLGPSSATSSRAMRHRGLVAAPKTLVAPPSRVLIGSIEPRDVCEGDTIEISPASGVFPAAKDASVLFSSCGLAGQVASWSDTRIRVVVPDHAESGPVWIASTTGQGAALQSHMHDIRACMSAMQQMQGPAIRGSFEIRSAYASAPGRIMRRTSGLLEPPVPLLDLPELGRGVAMQPRMDTSMCIGAGGVCLGPGPLTPTNAQITVQRKVRIPKFVPLDAVQLAADEYAVESSPVMLTWKSEGATAATLYVGTAAPIDVTGKTSVEIEVTEKTIVDLVMTNKCGPTSRRISLIPGVRAEWAQVSVTLAAGAKVDVELATPRAPTTDIEYTIWSDATSVLVLTPTVVLPAGATRVEIGLQRSSAPLGVGAGQSIANIFAQPDQAVHAALAPTTSLTVLASAATTVADPLHVVGTLRYRDSVPVLKGTGVCNDGPCPPVACPSGLCPIRRARVEVRAGGSPRNPSVALVTQTDANGLLDFSFPAGEYTAEVWLYAQTHAGQVNLRDDAGAWYRTKIGTFDGKAGAQDISQDFTDYERAATFNALDTLTTVYDYVSSALGIDEATAAKRLKYVSIVPRSWGGGGTTTLTHAGSLIWLWWGDSNPDPADTQTTTMFDDQTLIHEYGHHLQALTGSYYVYPVNYDGCFMSEICDNLINTAKPEHWGCQWETHPSLIWFEAFPNYLARIVTTRTPRHKAGFDAIWYAPKVAAGCALPGVPVVSRRDCALVGTTQHDEVITNAHVGDYFSGALAALAVNTPNGDAEVLNVFFDLHGLGANFPAFRAAWMARASSTGNGPMATAMSQVAQCYGF